MASLLGAVGVCFAGTEAVGALGAFVTDLSGGFPPQAASSAVMTSTNRRERLN